VPHNPWLMRHFVSISDTSHDDLQHTLDVALRLKKQYKSTGRNDPILANKTLAMIFEKPSLRTRVSFAVGMTHLGGNGLLLREEEVGLGKREPVQDVARVLSSMCDGIMARTFEHEKVVGLAKWATVPVINALTDYSHPCQAMADLMTLHEHFGKLAGLTLAYIGDGNNMAHSLACCCGSFGMKFIIAAPPGYSISQENIRQIMSHWPSLDLVEINDPIEAVKQADCIYTDTWVSMGQEKEKERRIADFKGFCVDARLVAAAPKQAVVMHCLPAYRGLEISEDVIEGNQSLIFPQAENRLHFQKGLLAVLMGNQ
jgi:ornithine carbamoyltransferase